jgi:hypothetical protein
MSERKSIMKFEYLPNEILLECFQYFNACEIFHSFDQLNNRFNQLIRHIPLCIDFQNINKSIFDEFCTKMLLNPTTKNEIYSLYLPNDNQCFQTNLFFSHFSFNEFPNLQTYISTISLLPDVIKNSLLIKPSNAKIKTADLIFSNLRTLSILRLDFTSLNTHQTSLITNLKLLECTFNQFNQLSTYFPMLKCLHIEDNMYCEENDTIPNSDKNQCFVYLNKLIMEDFFGTFDRFELLVKRTSNLKYLLIRAEKAFDMIDADRWEQLIRSLLPHLNVFKFIFNEFYYSQIADVMTKFQKFQTNFWQHEHHWFTELILDRRAIAICTIPYCKNIFRLALDVKRFKNNLRNRVHSHKNVRCLDLRIGPIKHDDEYYFPNVTELSLVLDHDTSLPMECIEYLKKVVNLFNVEHITIHHNQIVYHASFLSMIFKEARRLSCLTIRWSLLTSYLADQELCNYFNTMIKTLNIIDDYPDTYDDTAEKSHFDAEKFCQIFSNVEHLQIGTIRENELLSVFNRLSKLKILNALWIMNKHFNEDRIQFEKKLQKLNLIYHMEPPYRCYENDLSYIKLRIWFGNNTSK